MDAGRIPSEVRDMRRGCDGNEQHIRRLRQWSHTVRLGTCCWCCGLVGEAEGQDPDAADAEEPVSSAGGTAELESSGAGGTAEMKSVAGSSSVFMVPVVDHRATQWAGTWA